MLVEGEGDSGWKGGARLCQEAFAPPGQCVPPVPVCHLSLCPRGRQWLELLQHLSPPLPSTHLLLGTGEETNPENDHSKCVF